MKNLLILVLTVLFSINVSAQNRNEQNKESMKIKKTAFISDALNISNKKSDAFWPIYNKYHDEKEATMTSIRKTKYEIKKTYETSSEEDLYSKLSNLQRFEENALNSKIAYNASLSKILTAKERAILFMSDFNFKREQKKKSLKSKEKSPEEDK